MPKKKKGKKKKSKEELEAERLAREEEERLAEEAEQQRLTEEARVLEEERKRKAEEAARLRKAELERLDGEHEAEVELDQEHRQVAQEWATKLAEDEDWERYRQTDGGFDVSKENNLNAFLADVLSARVESLSEGCQVAVSVVQLLRQLVARRCKSQEEGDAMRIAKNFEFCRRFEEAVVSTLDNMLGVLVDRAQALSKGKNEYMQACAMEDLGVGIWMNVVPKGYRPRIVKYDELDCSITIPRNLMSHSLAARLVIHKDKYNSSLGAPDFETQDLSYGTAEAEHSVVMRRAAQLHKAWCAQRALPDGSFKPRMSRADGKLEDIANMPFEEISKQNQEQYVKEADFVERWLAVRGAGSALTAYGPSIQFELVDLPPTSKQLKKWKVRDTNGLEDGTVNKRTYPLEGTPAGQFVPPIKYNFKIPENVIVATELPENGEGDPVPKVAFWDSELMAWSSDDVTEASYSPEDRQLKFQAVAIGPLSLVQPRAIDIPLKMWEIKQMNYEGDLRLSLRTARNFPLDVKIGKHGCSLIITEEGENSTCKELHGLGGKLFGASELFEKLAFSGLNFLLTPADAKRINNQAKAEVLFKTLHWDIAQAAGPARFFMSKWNSARPATECVFNVAAAEAEHYDTVRLEVDEGTQRGTKYSVLQVKENKTKFSRKAMQSEVTHSRLGAALSSRFSADTKQELHDHRQDTATIENLRRVLDTINLFNCS